MMMDKDSIPTGPLPVDPIEEMVRAFSTLGREYISYPLPTRNLGIPGYPAEIGVRPLIGLDERDLSVKVSALAGKRFSEIEAMSDILNFLFSRLTNYADHKELFLTDRIYSLFLIARTTLGNIIPATLEGRDYTIDLSNLPVNELSPDQLLEEVKQTLIKFPQVKATTLDITSAGPVVNLELSIPPDHKYSIGVTLPRGKDEVSIGKADFSPLVRTVEKKEVSRTSRVRVMGILEALPAQYWKAIKAVIDTLSSVGLQLNETISTREDASVTLTVGDAVGVAIGALVS